jgi:hypothetical protein
MLKLNDSLIINEAYIVAAEFEKQEQNSENSFSVPYQIHQKQDLQSKSYLDRRNSENQICLSPRHIRVTLNTTPNELTSSNEVATTTFYSFEGDNT